MDGLLVPFIARSTECTVTVGLTRAFGAGARVLDDGDALSRHVVLISFVAAAVASWRTCERLLFFLLLRPFSWDSLTIGRWSGKSRGSMHVLSPELKTITASVG